MNRVDLENFYGRKTILDLLKKRVLDLKDGYRQNLCFLGDRHVGKSAILAKFLSELEDPRILPIFIDLESADLETFCRHYILGLLCSYARVKGLPFQDDIPSLVEAIQSDLPQTAKATKKIQALLLSGKISEAYREVLVLPQLFAVESDTFCLLILDEFDRLEACGLPDVFQELGKRIMTQKRCLYVVTSSRVVRATTVIAEKLSLLFGNFEIVSVAPFDFMTSEGFLRARLGPRKMSGALMNFLVDFTGGYPLYLELICEGLLTLAAIHRQEEIYRPLLNQAIENVLFHPWGVLSRHFEELTREVVAGPGQQGREVLLDRLAGGKQKTKDLAKAVGVKEKLLVPRLTHLVDLGVVEKNGNFYFLKDKLLRYWLKYVFQNRPYAAGYDLAQQREAFQQEISEAIHNALLSAEKDLPTRIIELLHCFEDESFQINNRRYKLPAFHDIVPAKTSGSGRLRDCDVIAAMTDEGPWLIVLTRQKLSEQDISLIVQESKTWEPKPHRSILISLSDLDEGTRVRALQERMWIWNEDELSTLLNLYDKPFILDNPDQGRACRVATVSRPFADGGRDKVAAEGI